MNIDLVHQLAASLLRFNEAKRRYYQQVLVAQLQTNGVITSVSDVCGRIDDQCANEPPVSNVVSLNERRGAKHGI